MTRPTILIVDDQAFVLSTLENAIRALQPEAQILLSSSAEEAWEIVQTYRPDIALIDITLPGGISGLELCERIKADPRHASLYVILMTASSAEWQGQVHHHCANALLRKPFHLAELQEKLQAAYRSVELLREHQYLPPDAEIGGELLQLLSGLLRLRSPSLAELAHRLMENCRWLAEHAENLSEEDRSLLPLAGFAYVLGRLALPDALLREPLTRSGHLSCELMIQVPLGAAAACRHHPRLAPLAPIVVAVAENYDGSGSPEHRRAWEIPLAARLLRLAVDFEETLWSTQQSATTTVAHMERSIRQAYDPQLFPLLAQYAALRSASATLYPIALHELRPGMELAHDLQTRSGLKLATAGTVITEQLLERLLRHHANDPIVGVIVVRSAPDPS